jgi:acetylornithine/succinyldiaminopimelate/putrescine aminotransferase
VRVDEGAHVGWIWWSSRAKNTLAAGKVSTVIVEPLRGEGGYRAPPPGFLTGVKDCCQRMDRHSIPPVCL